MCLFYALLSNTRGTVIYFFGLKAVLTLCKENNELLSLTSTVLSIFAEFFLYLKLTKDIATRDYCFGPTIFSYCKVDYDEPFKTWIKRLELFISVGDNFEILK
jgi:hypothetical protein